MEELYEMKRELGRGLQGVVRICSHRQTGLEFACKSTSFGSPSDDTACSARREMTALTALRAHPNIIFLHAHFEEESAVHAILELCRGGDLYDHISQKLKHLLSLGLQRCAANACLCCTMPSYKRDAHPSNNTESKSVCAGNACTPISIWPISEVEAAEIFAATLRAVAFCHERGIMHRDIKIENLLMPREGCSYSEIKLTDFGFAAEFYKAGQQKAVQGTVGTLHYVAPEIWMQQEYDEKADIWSMGVLLYILLFGCFPFEGKTGDEILHAMNLSNWKKAHNWPPNFFLVKDLLKKMLDLDPSKRYSAHILLTHPWLQRHGVAGPGSTARTFNM